MWSTAAEEGPSLLDSLAPDKLQPECPVTQIYTRSMNTCAFMFPLSPGALLPKLHHYNNPALIVTTEPKNHTWAAYQCIVQDVDQWV